MTNPQPEHWGSCLCGSLTYRIHQPLSDFGYCHCRSCRKASGSAHGANAGVARAAFELSDPQHTLREFESSAGKLRAFCSNCGSPLYAYLAANPEIIRIRLGSLDSPLNEAPRAHTFVSDKAGWDHIGLDIPQFETWAPRHVLEQTGSRQP